MAHFDQFMNALRGDQRLSRYLPRAVPSPSPEAVVLALVIQLADSVEGKREHPAFALLDEIDCPRPKTSRAHPTAPSAPERAQ